MVFQKTQLTFLLFTLVLFCWKISKRTLKWSFGCFGFCNQTQGNKYIASRHPMFYIFAKHDRNERLSTHGYQNKTHPSNLNELIWETDLKKIRLETLTNMEQNFHLQELAQQTQPMKFLPLFRQGLSCLQHQSQYRLSRYRLFWTTCLRIQRSNWKNRLYKLTTKCTRLTVVLHS